MYRKASTLAAFLLLSACGGGDGQSNPPPTGGGGTPAPSPAPTPTPPAVTYSKFADLTGIQTFRSTCAEQEIRDTTEILETRLTSTGNGLSIVRDIEAATWRVTDASADLKSGIDETFAASDLDEENASFGYESFRKPRGYDGISFGYGFNSDLDPDPQYARTASVYDGTDETIQYSLSCIFGVETKPEDQFPVLVSPSSVMGYKSLVASGQATIGAGANYRELITGDGLQSAYYYDLRANKGTVQFDLSTLDITNNTYQFVDTLRANIQIDPEKFTFQADLTAEVSGSTVPAGSVVGVFYGPGGAEIGMVLTINYLDSAGRPIKGSFVIIGTDQAEFVPT